MILDFTIEYVGRFLRVLHHCNIQNMYFKMWCFFIFSNTIRRLNDTHRGCLFFYP